MDTNELFKDQRKYNSFVPVLTVLVLLHLYTCYLMITLILREVKKYNKYKASSRAISNFIMRSSGIEYIKLMGPTVIAPLEANLYFLCNHKHL